MAHGHLPNLLGRMGIKARLVYPARDVVEGDGGNRDCCRLLPDFPSRQPARMPGLKIVRCGAAGSGTLSSSVAV